MGTRARPSLEPSSKGVQRAIQGARQASPGTVLSGLSSLWEHSLPWTWGLQAASTQVQPHQTEATAVVRMVTKPGAGQGWLPRSPRAPRTEKPKGARSWGN